MKTHTSLIYTPIILGITIMIGLFFIKPLYQEYIHKTSTLSLLEKEKTKKQAEYDNLLKIKNISASGSIDESHKKIQRISKKWNPSDIMEVVLLSDYTRATVGKGPRIKISSISIDKGTRLPSGLSLGKVSFTVSADTLEDIIEYITFLTTDSPYTFVIDQISLPLDTSPDEIQSVNGYTLELNLGVYHYEG